MPDTLIVAKQWNQTTSLGTGSAPFAGSNTEGGGTDWTDLGNIAGSPLYNQSGGKILFAQVNAANNNPPRNTLTFRGTGSSYQDGEVFSAGSTAPIGVVGRISTAGAGWSAFIYSGSIFVWAYSNASGTLTRVYNVSTAVTATLTGDCVIALRLTQSGNVVTPVVKLYAGVNLATFDPTSPGTPAQTYTPATFDATSYADLRSAGFWGVSDYTGKNLSTHAWLYLAGTELTAGSAQENWTAVTATKLTFTGASGGGGSKTYSLWRRVAGVGSFVQVQTGLTPGSLYDTGLTAETSYDYQFRVNDGTTTVNYTTVTVTTSRDAIAVFGDSNLDSAYGVAQNQKAPYKLDAALDAAGYPTAIYSYALSGTTSGLWAGSQSDAGIAEMLAMGVTKVIVMLGTNDAKTANNVSAATYETNLVSLETKIRASVSTATILYTAPPFAQASGEWGAGTDALIQAYGDKVRTRAAATGNKLLDGATQAASFYKAVSDNVGAYLGDAVHLTATGHTALKDFWYSAFAAFYLPTYSGVTITNGATASVTGEATLQLAATVQGTNSPSQTVTWSIVSGSGTVNSSGLFTAPGAGQTDKTTVVKATAADGTTNDTISITTPSAGSGTGGTDLTYMGPFRAFVGGVPDNETLTLIEGEDKPILLQVVEKAGTPFSLSGLVDANITAEVRTSAGATTATPAVEILSDVMGMVSLTDWALLTDAVASGLTLTLAITIDGDIHITKPIPTEVISR